MDFEVDFEVDACFHPVRNESQDERHQKRRIYIHAEHKDIHIYIPSSRYFSNLLWDTVLEIKGFHLTDTDTRADTDAVTDSDAKSK